MEKMLRCIEDRPGLLFVLVMLAVVLMLGGAIRVWPESPDPLHGPHVDAEQNLKLAVAESQIKDLQKDMATLTGVVEVIDGRMWTGLFLVAGTFLGSFLSAFLSLLVLKGNGDSRKKNRCDFVSAEDTGDGTKQ